MTFMNILLMGPQGSGKGTQAKILVEKFKLLHFEAGDFLRDIAKTNEKLREMMDKGELVPDEEMVSYVTAYLDEKQNYDNLLFDGFPRDLEQFNLFSNWLDDRQIKIDTLLLLEIGEEETLKRLTLRKLKEGRGDDNPDAIKKRLDLYKDRTEKLVNEISHKMKIIRVDGERSVDEIALDLEKIINNL